MAHKSKKDKEQDKRRGLGDGQMTTQTGGTNNGGQREDNNKGERDRDRTNERGNRGRQG